MQELAVCLRDASKRYGRGSKATHVLCNMDMNVAKGSIYGLLGASGCGKTTLLSCIVGRQALDSGYIMVLGGTPGHKESGVPGPKVGYMPQNTALVSELTVKDTVFYFGWLFNMGRTQLQERYDFLSLLLELPADSISIKNLSGGQQRRVSLAAALVHDPELLILDEPTVGVDPLLRSSIWEYLIRITSDKRVTVIVTTHYIEEAMQAHTIGLMRLGKLLAEDSPQQLLIQYSCPNLESVFLRLSEEQGDINTKIKRKKSTSLKRQAISESMQPLPVEDGRKSGVSTDRQALYSSLGNGIAFVALFPIMQVSLFFFAIGHYPTSILLAVVNEELVGFATCGEMLNQVNESYISSNASDDCGVTMLSCAYLELMNDSMITKKYFPDKESGKAKVRAGDAIGMLYFPPNFTNQLRARHLLGKQASIGTFESSEIQVYMDMTDQQTATLVKSMLFEQFQHLADLLDFACDMHIRGAGNALQFNTPVYGPNYPRYDTFMAPGVLTSTVFFLATTITATLIVTDRTEGIWDRNIVAGVTAIEILLSHFLSQVACVVLQVMEVVFTSLLLFGLECNGSLFTLLGITLMMGFCGMMFGLVISVFSSSFTMAIFMSLGSYIPFINLSGMLWPIEGMPTALRWFSLFMPGTLPTLAVSNVLVRGWSLFHPQVYRGVLAGVAWIVLQLTLAIFVLKFKDRNMVA
ncbi:ABC transporter G family member 20 [Anabrus simplex]|uniref:ABC transporter G family member 20 n=1 Tax=Anabrus simplex TaxID=316456 RepID=UPI0035A2783E